jgi:phosphoglycerate kinase
LINKLSDCQLFKEYPAPCSKYNVIVTFQIGNSIYDEEGGKIVKKLMDKAKSNNVQIHLPVDFVTADKFAEDATVGSGSLEAGIPDGWMGLDIGPKTRELFKEPVNRAKVIVWNG